jgi:hypothetical protein
MNLMPNLEPAPLAKSKSYTPSVRPPVSRKKGGRDSNVGTERKPLRESLGPLSTIAQAD